MRILIMMSGLAMGGGERIIVSVLPYLKSNGVTPFLCTLNTRRDSPLTETFAETGITRFDLEAKRLTDPAAFRRFTALLHAENIDIVNTQDQDTHVFGGLARKRLKIPTVMTRHVLAEPTTTLKETVRAKLVLWAMRYGADKLIAVSESVRSLIAQQANVPLSKIETIYNGLDPEKFATWDQREAKRAELGWDLDRPIIIMVAVLRAGKGHEVLFEAIPQIKAAVPDAQIKLVGDGELNETLRQQAANFGDTVEFMGQRMDVSELLGASDVLVLPSWSEALPTVLIEAGAAALSVVATDVGGTAEIVEDGKTGYIVPPGDAAQLAQRLIDTLQNPDRARQMGQQAHKRVVGTFSLNRQAQTMIRLYERVIEAKKER